MPLVLCSYCWISAPWRASWLVACVYQCLGVSALLVADGERAASGRCWHVAIPPMGLPVVPIHQRFWPDESSSQVGSLDDTHFAEWSGMSWSLER